VGTFVFFVWERPTALRIMLCSSALSDCNSLATAVPQYNVYRQLMASIDVPELNSQAQAIT
jgi:hypothetical protein